MFSPGAQAGMSIAASPPAPTEAMFNFSFNVLKPAAFREGVLANPPAGTAPASRGPKKKCRLDNPLPDISALPIGNCPLSCGEISRIDPGCQPKSAQIRPNPPSI